MTTLKLTVPTMACGACTSTITQAIHKVDPDAEVEADPSTKLVKINTVASNAEITEAIAAAGYPIA
ncbi:MAG: heavy-metal-associated domain-containing protein [Leptolyngbyaceae cyanobacterium SM1_1_3]|nr:heavy-metal-associated domain-containing protein [Leptolyngbyaceae cyanobacterium SM1_1_3]NJN01853.1 heavy-metal-associated domain-containing protein [Leptolyngbyaceae cyanobacterium RM1_1_2]NJO10313.1 heavy-metal-associated domain-containing protein [Leptolyngbyaceae cyanobacterium SL_1_1]